MTVRTGATRLTQRIAAVVRDRLSLASGDPGGAAAFGADGSHVNMLRTRETVAASYLRGTGIEVGALHQPLKVPASVTVRYVDRMTTAELRRQYEELAGYPLVEIDIIDNGEQLGTLQDATQDFVIANHFLEHCQNPILAVQNLVRVLKAGGVLYLAVPDKRFTFDRDRPCTTVEHIEKDFVEGPEWSRRQHFEEWSRLVNKRGDAAEHAAEVEHLLDIDYSIHFHVWSARELTELVATLQHHAPFELELFLRNGPETILILRRT